MKKIKVFLTVIVVFVLSTTVYANGQEKSGINYAIDKLTPLLQKLAEKLGTTAGAVWQMLVVQARVNFWIDILGIIFMTTLCAISSVYFKKALKQEEDTPRLAWGLIFGFLFIIWLLIIAFDAPDAITSLLNPQYWALQNILSQLK